MPTSPVAAPVYQGVSGQFPCLSCHTDRKVLTPEGFSDTKPSPAAYEVRVWFRTTVLTGFESSFSGNIGAQMAPGDSLSGTGPKSLRRNKVRVFSRTTQYSGCKKRHWSKPKPPTLLCPPPSKMEYRFSLFSILLLSTLVALLSVVLKRYLI